jgi:hypothetical protein
MLNMESLHPVSRREKSTLRRAKGGLFTDAIRTMEIDLTVVEVDA